MKESLEVKHNSRRQWRCPTCNRWQAVTRMYEAVDYVRECSVCRTRVVITATAVRTVKYCIAEVRLIPRRARTAKDGKEQTG